MDPDWAVIPLGFLALVLLVGVGMFIVFQIQPDTPGGVFRMLRVFQLVPRNRLR